MRRARRSRRRTPNSPPPWRDRAPWEERISDQLSRGQCEGPGWDRGLHEVTAVLVEPRNLEDVQHVVDVRLVQAMRQNRACKVRVALEVERRAADELVHVRVAPGPEQVVDAASHLVNAIGRQRVLFSVSTSELLGPFYRVKREGG